MKKTIAKFFFKERSMAGLLSVTFIGMAMVIGLAAAQSKTTASVTIAPLTADEKEQLRTDQIDVAAASAAYQKLVDDTNQRLLRTQEYKNLLAAQDQMRQHVDAVFMNRKLINEKDAFLCDGPDASRPACAKLAKRGLVLVSAPPAEEKK